MIIGRREEKGTDEVEELGVDGEGEGLVAAARAAEDGQGLFTDEFEMEDDEAKAREERERDDLIDLGTVVDGDDESAPVRGTSSRE